MYNVLVVSLQIHIAAVFLDVYHFRYCFIIAHFLLLYLWPNLNRSSFFKVTYAQVPPHFLSISALCSLMALHFVWPDVIWMEHICAHVCFVCDWVVAAATHAAVLLWVTSVGTTKHNYSDEQWMAQWFLELTYLKDHEASLSQLFHVCPEIRTRRVRGLQNTYTSRALTQTRLLLWYTVL